MSNTGSMKRFSGFLTLKSCLLAAGLSLIGLLLVALLQPVLPFPLSAKGYIPLHIVFEVSSIVISYAIFTVGWYGYKRTRNPRDLFIAVAFLTIGAIDFVHMLSFNGMPDFLGTNSVGKAAGYWLVARMFEAVALLAVAFIASSKFRKWITPRVLVPTAVVFSLATVVLITTFETQVSSLLFNDETGLTMFKIGVEWVIIGFYATALVALNRVNDSWKESTRFLQMGLVFAISSEICFTLYQSAFDGYNLLGHVYKVAAYYLVLQALMVSSLGRPYDELTHAKDRLQKSFLQVGEALSTGLQKNQTLTLITSLARKIFEADFAAIGEVQSNDTLIIANADGTEIGDMQVPVRGSIAGESFTMHKPLLIDDLRKHPRFSNHIYTKAGMRSVISAPIVRDGQLYGAIYVASNQPNAFSSEDTGILTAFARHAAVAIANAEHYEREHRIADVLQRSIFPPPKLEFGAFSVAGKYKPAWNEANVGGDFYDYFDLGDGRLGLIIGDVSGKGLDAAVHTAIVKYSCQAYLRDGYSPSATLAKLEDAIDDRAKTFRIPDNVFITLFCAVLDTRTGQMVYSNAGHEPPIILGADGEVVDLDSTGPLVGMGVPLPFDESEVVMHPGSVLVMYTDGITESRYGGEFYGQEGLVEAIRSCRECPSDELSERVYESAKSFARGTLHDDVALVVVKRSVDGLFDVENT